MTGLGVVRASGGWVASQRERALVWGTSANSELRTGVFASRASRLTTGIVVETQKVPVCGTEANAGIAVRIKIGQSFRATMVPAWFPKSCARISFRNCLIEKQLARQRRYRGIPLINN